jgi:hypothetical protein
MKAFTNPCVLSPAPDGVRGQGLVRRASEKPPQRFADVRALAGSREQIQPDKNGDGTPAVPIRPEGEQGALNVRRRSIRSIPDQSRVATGISLSDHAPDVPMRIKTDVARADSAPAWFSTDRRQKGSPSSETAGCASHATPIGPVACRCAVHTPENSSSVFRPPSSTEGPPDTPIHATGGIKAARPDKAEARASKPAPAGVSHGTPQKPQKEDGGDSTQVALNDKRNAGCKDQAVETARYAQAGSNKDQDPAVEVPRRPERGLQGLRSPSQQATVSTRNDTPAGQNPKVEAASSGGKKTQPGNAKEGGSLQAEPLTSSSGQPAGVTLRPPGETQPHAVADATATKSIVRNVGEQILDSLQPSVAQGDRQILIRLQPPELGTVVVRFQERGQHLDGTLEVGKSETRREIERAVPDVVRSLQDAGIPIRRLDVVTADAPEQDLGKGHLQQDAWSGQQGSGQNRDSLPASQTSWSQGAADSPVNAEETASADAPVRPSQGRIDMLL